MDIQTYPMKLNPAYQDYIWGGSRLKKKYGKHIDVSPLAESWELSCHENGLAAIDNGVFAGKTLKDALALVKREGGDWVGKSAKAEADFPLLIKWIDAEDKLSVQVHPGDTYANEHENGSLGKTEMWYIADAKPGAKLVYGFLRDVTRREFQEAIETGTLQDILRYVTVRKGDCFFIPAGLVHAIGEGILIVEIQENSDNTYRVYDWGRVGKDGNPRPLHIQKALEVSRLKREETDDFHPAAPQEIYGGMCTFLAQCPYFTVFRYEVKSRTALSAGDDSFHSLTFLEGGAEIKVSGGETVSAKKGDTIFIPAGAGEYVIDGKSSFLLAKL